MNRTIYLMFVCLFIVSFSVFATEGGKPAIEKGKTKVVKKTKKKISTIKKDANRIAAKAKVVKKSYKNMQKYKSGKSVAATPRYTKSFVSKVLADENGNIINGENAEIVHPIASLTKIMTALIAIEKIEKGELKGEDLVYVSKEAVKLGGSISGIRYNEYVTLEDLLKSAIIKSGNDSAYLIGKYVGGGNEGKFIEMMNKRAEELGMKDTKYYTSSGLPPYYYSKAGIEAKERDYDISTAADIAKLAAEVVRHQIYMDIASQYYTKIKNGKVTLRNHNQLVSKYDCIDGLKTGFHNIGHYNVVISAKKDGVRLLAVVFGSPTLSVREREVITLLDTGYQSLGFSGLTKHTVLDYNRGSD